MPILLKKIEGSIISLFDSQSSDFTGEIRLINSIIGEIGVEDYIKLTTVEGFVQDFSSVSNGEFFVITPTKFGAVGCTNHIELNISY